MYMYNYTTMPYKEGTRFARKSVRYARRGAMARYVPKNKKGKRALNIANVIKDVALIKRSLNTEKKVINQTLLGLSANRGSSLVQALEYPVNQGLTDKTRIGSHIKVTGLNLRMRLRLHASANENVTNKLQNVRYKLYVIWMKDASVLLTPQDVLEEDFDGNYSVSSPFNKYNYKNFIITNKFEGTMKFTQGLHDLRANEVEELRYINAHKNLSLKMDFRSSDDPILPGVLETYKPYLFLLSDASERDGDEKIDFDIMSKMFYVDN
nr:putative capsid protein [Avon-Heathcote Estuary associated circular virus 4]